MMTTNPTACLTCRPDPLTAAICQACALSPGANDDMSCSPGHPRQLCLWCAAVAPAVAAHAGKKPRSGEALTAADYTRWAEATIDTDDGEIAWQYLANWHARDSYAPLPALGLSA
ncbi:hypothetical protein EDL96_08285 [Kocuria soli]|uniref:Uncharacterized protein n=1 Tax=Kocuria soli TaxID=2485125 RepID=A0A3N3ZP63_9MICC|nr:hypothetical protein [Kocuria soli]ROZ62773.1 hypothetical protein EDL96_08285 [Kocuria soli]